jgi:hypothetical protein
MRQVMAVAAVAALALVAGACGGDDEETTEETTTTAELDGEATSTTVEPLSDEEFDAQVEPLVAELEAAGTDLCAVLQAASASGPESSAATEAQVRTTVDAQVKILRAIAATEPVDEPNAAVINRVADELAAAAEEDGYTVDFVLGEAFTSLLGAEDFTVAITAYQTRQASDCEIDGSIPAEGETETTEAP